MTGRWQILVAAVAVLVAVSGVNLPVAAQKSSDQPELKSFLAAFDANRTDLKSYTAKFRQVKFNSLFKEYSEPSVGVLTYKRPGRVLWNYETPDKMTLLLRDRQVHMYIADMAQMDVYDFRDDQSMKALFLGFDQTAADLQKAYTLHLFAPGKDYPDSWAVELKPRDNKMTNYFDAVKLWMRKKDFAVTRIVISGPGNDGNVTEITLSDIRTNIDVPDTVFDLDVPPETSVVYHTADELKPVSAEEKTP